MRKLLQWNIPFPTHRQTCRISMRAVLCNSRLKLQSQPESRNRIDSPHRIESHSRTETHSRTESHSRMNRSDCSISTGMAVFHRMEMPIISNLCRRRVPGSPICHRSEEHTSELQSRGHLVCRLLLEKKKV